jgi:RNA polymerase sigma-70 factor (ECF subfamily)
MSEDCSCVEQGSIYIELSDRQLFDAVYRQMRSLAGAAAPDLEDLVQAAAEQVFRCRDSFQGRSELATWTYSICYRVLLNQRRWYRRWAARFCLSDEVVPIAVAAPLASSMLEARERLVQLHAAIAQMSDKYRVVVVLHDLEGLSSEEIVAIVGANPNTVRSRLRDGRKQLLRLLKLDPQFDPIGGSGELFATCSD